MTGFQTKIIFKLIDSIQSTVNDPQPLNVDRVNFLLDAELKKRQQEHPGDAKKAKEIIVDVYAEFIDALNLVNRRLCKIIEEVAVGKIS